jgi:hypothetical protein
MNAKNIFPTQPALLHSSERYVEFRLCGRRYTVSFGSFIGLLSYLVVAGMWLSAAAATPGLAQGAIEGAAATVEGEAEVSRQEWVERIQGARQRAKDAALEHRMHPERYAPSPEDKARISSERVLNDDSLQPGDIVSTDKGLFVFRGNADQPRKSEDFVPLRSR